MNTQTLCQATFTDGDTTPSVKNANFFTTDNSNSTTISDFDDGIQGQWIVILFGDGNTTIQAAGNLNLNSGANLTGTENDTICFITPDGTNWYAYGPSDNTS